MAADRETDPTTLRIEDGDAVVPDAEDLPTHEDLAPEEPSAAAPAIGDPDKTSAVPPPVPAHGEMASREQIREAVLAAEEAGDGGDGSGSTAAGDGGTDQPEQGATGHG
ncbi:MAG: hypothetical protein JWM47_2552 [Acidimicrobiales bacterium]|nr:hypothetical protein [Acidimicrobiales bacterium]